MYVRIVERSTRVTQYADEDEEWLISSIAMSNLKGQNIEKCSLLLTIVTFLHRDK